MAHLDLLPKRAHLQGALVDVGLSHDDADRALALVATHLAEWSSYHENRARLTDNDDARQDEGAASALDWIAGDLRRQS